MDLFALLFFTPTNIPVSKHGPRLSMTLVVQVATMALALLHRQLFFVRLHLVARCLIDAKLITTSSIALEDSRRTMASVL
jgi:hypothetical protein